MQPRVLCVLAGEDLPAKLLGDWGRSADVVFAADRGADLLLAAGVTPHHVVGDMDSVSPEALSQAHVVHEALDQFLSDADKVLQLVERMGFASTTIAGLEGDLLGHVLGSLSSCVRSTLNIRLALRRGMGFVVRGGENVSLQLAEGSKVSVLPLLPSEGVHFSGVQWPLDGVSMAFDGLVSLSNRSTGDEVKLSLETGVCVLVAEMPRAEMPQW